MLNGKLLYNGFALDIVRRFQSKFDDMTVVHNFEYGPEFELALCDVLRTILPARARVCRGYVVGADGSMAGDDIIIFDAARFPTLRALGDDLSKKEHVPAEAVLAYIEAKHTLYIGGSNGQTLDYACEQAGRVKALHRKAVTYADAVPGVTLGAGFHYAAPQGGPSILNPWYTAVFARHFKVHGSYHVPDDFGPPGTNESTDDWSFRSGYSTLNKAARYPLPDVIAAGDTVVCPAHFPHNGEPALSCFLTPSTRHVFVPSPGVTLGLAALHLLWAMESLVLGEIPWSKMILELGGFAQSRTLQSLEGPAVSRAKET